MVRSTLRVGLPASAPSLVPQVVEVDTPTFTPRAYPQGGVSEGVEHPLKVWEVVNVNYV